MTNLDQVPGFLCFSPKFLQKKTFTSQLLRKCRRFYFSIFKKTYVNESITKSRTGQCNRSGKCCALVYKCPFFARNAESTPYGRLYGVFRPDSCKNYPLDPVDMEVDGCGYKFH